MADWFALTRLGRLDLKDAPYLPRNLWRATEPEALFNQINEELVEAVRGDRQKLDALEQRMLWLYVCISTR
jgi:hypothetical protein